MAIDFSALLYGPVHSVLGVDVTFTTEEGVSLSMIAIDKSVPFETSREGVAIETIRPAAVVRASDLIALDATADDLVGAELLMNGLTWRVEAVQPRPSPRGESDGEVWCILIRIDE